MTDYPHEDEPVQRIAITIEMPAGIGTETIAVTALLDVLRHLEHDGLRPYRTVLEVTEAPTT